MKSLIINKYNFKIIFTTISFLVLFSCFSYSADKKAIFKELREEYQQYAKSAILPELKIWKTEFDKSLSAEDLQKLNRLREQATQKKKCIKDCNMQQHNYNKDSNCCSTKHHKKYHRHNNRNQSNWDSLLRELSPIIEKYKSNLVVIGNKAQTKSEEWQKSYNQIYENWKLKYHTELSELKQNCLNLDSSKTRKMKRQNRVLKEEEFKNNFPFKNIDNKRKMAMFLLWDGNTEMIYHFQHNHFSK